MAKKKQEVALMREIESQEEWEDVMGKEGLWVVDVYQEWSGPCDAMIGNFRRMKNELGDDLLHFAKAKSDTIESLEKYRGSCEPCYLFFATGVLVAFVHGANAPLILRTLTEQLAQEHKVIDGSAERKEVKDPFVANREAAEDAQKEEDEEDDDTVAHRRVSTLPGDYEEVEEGYTVAIIKPNIVAEGRVDEILAEMKARGIEVLAQEERQLTEEEAREFYSHLKDEDYFSELVDFMASGPSHMLVLTKGQEDDSIIKDWRDMLGPPNVEDAREQAPESLRAKYGQEGLMNALHGSDSKETAARELAFFFPHMNKPTMQRKKKEIQRTLALIRPDAFAKNRDAILERIKEAGFQIALQKEVMLTKEQAEEFYSEHAGQPYYEDLTTRMSSGPLLALGLAREDAVENWRGLLGPTDVEEAKTSAPDSLRAMFAEGDSPINQLHGSDSVEAAQKELKFFFPVEQTVAMIKPDAIGTKDAIVDKIHQAGFRIAARRETLITRDIAESFYEDQKDKEYYNDLVEHMISGPTMFMVLSREGAVQGWRQEIGPTDPAAAKEQAPDSLRAQFGTDILKNAVHGASSAEEAQKKIHSVFGDMEFNDDEQVQQEAEEQAISGSPVPQPADVAPEYRQQAEQPQEAEQQQQEAEQPQEQAEQPQEQAEQPQEQAEQPQEQAEQPQAEQEPKTKAEEQAETQQAEEPAEAEGKAEGEGQSEEKPAAEEEAAEKTEVEEKRSESPAEKEESADKTEGEVEQKPSKHYADQTAEQGEDGQAAQQMAAEEQGTQDTPASQQDTEPPQADGDKSEGTEKAEEPQGEKSEPDSNENQADSQAGGQAEEQKGDDSNMEQKDASDAKKGDEEKPEA